MIEARFETIGKFLLLPAASPDFVDVPGLHNTPYTELFQAFAVAFLTTLSYLLNLIRHLLSSCLRRVYDVALLR